MTAVTGWQGGRLNTGLGWTTCFQAADAGTLASGSTVLSSQGDITNGTSLDQFADISFSCSLTSATPPAGSNVAFWIFALNQDGTTYGDNQFTASTPAAKTPSFPPAGVFPVPSSGAVTSVVGLIQGMVIPPGTFRFAVQNNIGSAFTAATIKFRSYNIRVDNPS